MTNIKKNNNSFNNKNYIEKNFVIFGNGKFSKLVLYYLKNDTPFYKNLKAFVAPKQYILEERIDKISVIDEDNFILNYNPSTTIIILGIGSIKKNLVRKLVFEKYKAMGFKFFNYVSSEAQVYSEINSEAVLIFASTIIEPNVKIGSNVIFRSSVVISHNCNIENHVFISNGVYAAGNVTIKEQSFIGVRSVIKDSIVIAKRSFIDALSYVHVSTKEDQILRGNPARAINLKIRN